MLPDHKKINYQALIEKLKPHCFNNEPNESGCASVFFHAMDLGKILGLCSASTEMTILGIPQESWAFLIDVATILHEFGYHMDGMYGTGNSVKSA